MFRVLIADDHPIIRAGIKEILKSEKSIEIIGESSTSQETISFFEKKKQCDILILDISMPDMDGLRIVKDIKRLTHSKVKILILSMHAEQQYIVEALRLGVDGYLTKESIPEELINAIKTILDGKKYIAPTITKSVINGFLEKTDEGKKPHEKLSTREYQVMMMLSSGKSIKEIAKELYLSHKTVSTYKKRIFEKLNVQNIAQLVIYVSHNIKISDF